MHVSIQVLQYISNALYDTTVKVNCSSSKTIKLCLMEKNIYCAFFFFFKSWNVELSIFSVLSSLRWLPYWTVQSWSKHCWSRWTLKNQSGLTQYKFVSQHPFNILLLSNILYLCHLERTTCKIPEAGKARTGASYSVSKHWLGDSFKLWIPTACQHVPVHWGELTGASQDIKILGNHIYNFWTWHQLLL